MVRGIFPLALTLVPIFGCAPDETNVDDEAGESDEAEAGTETGEEVELGPLALGIDIVEVEANQGTAVLIGQNGEWVGPEGRNAYLLRDRDTLVRLAHTVGPDWVPREIAGILHLYDANGVELVQRTRTFMVEGNSDPKSLDSAFYFSVLAAEAQPGLRYWVELREASTAFDAGGATQGTAVTPPDDALVGYEQTPLELRIMLVPIEYTYINPPTTAVVTESDLQIVTDDVLQKNPVQSVELQVHETYQYTQHITDLGQLLSPMMALRQADNADPNLYYHALVDVRGPSVNMVAGIAQIAGSDKASAISRVAATVWYKPGDLMSPAGSAEVITHEVGHNQGLAHVYCPGAGIPAAGPDPAYPHMDGEIGVYGFGIRNFRLYTPTSAHDYMTYCGNQWVSDWTWNKTYNRIRELTSWDYEGTAGEGPHDQPLLVGTLFEDGREEWWAMVGPMPTIEQRSGEQRIDVFGPGAELLDQQFAAVSMLSDHATKMVVVPLTIPFDQLERIDRVDWRGEIHAIDRADIVLGHDVEFDVALHP